MSEVKETLRLLFCGNVDDGKSTLIGRLLYDSRAIHQDALSDFLQKQHHEPGDLKKLEFSQLVDGLVAESSEKMTIDVGYRGFSSRVRRYVLAVSPGHTKFMRNFAAAATQSDVAVILLDAEKGITSQTLYHTYLCHIFGVQNFILVVSKMDLVSYSESRFNNLCTEYQKRTQFLKDVSLKMIPTSAIFGENIVNGSETMNWYSGPVLIQCLDQVGSQKSGGTLPHIILQASMVSHSCSRTYYGSYFGQAGRQDAKFMNVSTAEIFSLSDLRVRGEVCNEIVSDQEISFSLPEHQQLFRGDVLINPGHDMIALTSRIKAKIYLDSDFKTEMKDNVIVQIGTQKKTAKIINISFDQNVQASLSDREDDVQKSRIADIEMEFSEAVVAAIFTDSYSLGSLMLISPFTHSTLGFGIITSCEKPGEIKKPDSVIEHTLGKVIWILGLPSAGKTTLANELKLQLTQKGHQPVILDADNLRQGLNSDLGFRDEDKIENIRRIAEMANILCQQGLTVIVSAITPLQQARDTAKKIIGKENYFEIYLSTPVEECSRRDSKGLYAKARQNSVINLPGANGAFEIPGESDLVIDNTDKEPAETAEMAVHSLLGIKEKI